MVSTAVLCAMYPPADPLARIRYPWQSMTAAQIVDEMWEFMSHMTPHNPGELHCLRQVVIPASRRETKQHSERLRDLVRVRWP